MNSQGMNSQGMNSQGMNSQGMNSQGMKPQGMKPQGTGSQGMLSIGEAAADSGVPAKTIRFYEEAGIIKPAQRGENGYRVYSEADVQTLHFIHRARSLGFSLKDVAELLELYHNRKRASREVKKLALQHVAELDRKIAEMTNVRNTIAALAEKCHGNHRPECPILDELGATAEL